MAQVIVLNFQKSEAKANTLESIFESSPSEAVIDKAAANRASRMNIKGHQVTYLDFEDATGEQRREVIKKCHADTRLYLCGHGNGTDSSFAGRTTQDIADLLRKYGLQSVHRIVLYGCKTHECARKLRELLAVQNDQLPPVKCEVAGYNFQKGTAAEKDKYRGKTVVFTKDGPRYFRTPGKSKDQAKKGDINKDPAKIIYSAAGEKYHFGI
jgi:hypothetical protein